MAGHESATPLSLLKTAVGGFAGLFPLSGKPLPKKGEGLSFPVQPESHGLRSGGPKKRALVRKVPESYTRALARYFGSGPTDVEAAKAQHQRYINALESNGVVVHALDADDNHPDCIFVEDQAVVIDGKMLLPSPATRLAWRNNRPSPNFS